MPESSRSFLEPDASSDPPTEDSLNLAGTIIDHRYLVERLVGWGGFGLVYRATHLRFESPVAIKVLRIPPFCAREERERVVSRFAEEGKLAFGLGALHPGIVRVFETGTLGPEIAPLTPYLAMEWLDGLPLTRFLAERRQRGLAKMTLSETLGLLEVAVQGLSVVHRTRVAHCDVKPANIFICGSGGRRFAKLVDFGLAEVATESVTASCSSGTAGRRAFTLAYASPEQWSSRLGRTGPWTDVHALALVCTELLCGRRAFLERDPQRLMAACVDPSARPTPGRLGTPQTPAVERIFEKALAVSARARFPDAGEFWQALLHAAASDASHTRPSGDLAMAVTPSEHDEARASITAPTESPGSEGLGAALPARSEKSRTWRTVLPATVSAAAISTAVALLLPSTRNGGGAAVPVATARAVSVERARPMVSDSETLPAAVQPQPTGPSAVPPAASGPEAFGARARARVPAIRLPENAPVRSATAESEATSSSSQAPSTSSEPVQSPALVATSAPSKLEDLLNTEALTTRQ